MGRKKLFGRTIRHEWHAGDRVLQTTPAARVAVAKTHDEDGQLHALQALAEARQALGAPDQAVIALKQAIALADL